MSSDNLTACESLFAGRLSQGIVIYQTTYMTVFFVVLIVTTFLWYQHKEHPLLKVRLWPVFLVQSCAVVFYLLFDLLFALNEPSELTQCHANSIFGMLTMLVPAPAMVFRYILHKRANYNIKLHAVFQRETYDWDQSPTSLLSDDSHKSSIKELQRMKAASSPTRHLQLNCIIWGLLILLAMVSSYSRCTGFLFEPCSYMQPEGFGPYGSWLVGSFIIFCMQFKVEKIQAGFVDRYHSLRIFTIVGMFSALPVFVACIFFISNRDILAQEGNDNITFSLHMITDATMAVFYFFAGPYLIIIVLLEKNMPNIDQERLELDLDHIMHNSVYSPYFSQFLQETLSDENLQFLFAIEKLRKLPESKVPEQARAIYRHFISPNGVAQVNLSYETTIKIENSYSQKIYSRDMFVEAEGDIRRLLIFNSMKAFKRSEYYTQMTVNGQL